MNHFATALCAGFIATVLVSGTAFVPTPAEAATDNGMALKDATVACKAEAKGQKISGGRPGSLHVLDTYGYDIQFASIAEENAFRR